MNLGMHHMRRKRRGGGELSAFDYLMYGIGLVQPAALIPQVVAVYIDGNKQGVSMTTWLLLTVFNVLWAAYGYRHRDVPIMVANILLTVLDVAIVLGVLFY